MTNPEPLRMAFDREKIAEALHAADPWLYGQDHEGEDVYKPWEAAPEAVKDHYRKSVDAALAALGLDDLDAMTRRMAEAMEVYYPDPTGGHYWYRMAREGLQAAFLATGEPQDG